MHLKGGPWHFERSFDRILLIHKNTVYIEIYLLYCHRGKGLGTALWTDVTNMIFNQKINIYFSFTI